MNKSNLVTLLVVVALVAGYAGWRSGAGGPKPTDMKETDAQRDQAVRDAFAGSGGSGASQPATAAELAALNGVFDRLGAAIRAKDSAAIAGLLDGQMMVGAMQQRGVIKLGSKSERDRIATLTSTKLGEQLAAQSDLFSWVTHTIRKAAAINTERTELVAYVQHRDAEGITSKMRWWLSRSGDTWRVYDYEDLSIGMRVSSLMEMGMNAAKANDPWMASMPTLMQAVQTMVGGDVDTAATMLDSLAGRGLPPQFESLRLMFVGAVAVQRADSDAALAAFDEANRLNSDMPMLHYMRAEALLGAERYDDALAEADRYIQKLGSDADVELVIGKAYYWKDQHTEAEKHFRLGLADDPQSLDHLSWLPYSIDADRLAELDPYLAALSQPGEQLPTLVDVWIADEEPAPVHHVIAYLRRTKPGDATADAFAAKLDASGLLNQPAEPTEPAPTPAEPATAP